MLDGLLDLVARIRSTLRTLLPSPVREIFLTSEGKWSRSTALDPLFKLLGLLLIAILILKNVEGLPSWLVPAFVIVFFLFAVGVAGYSLFLLVKNPDTLRSERFIIQQLALEKIYGDSLHGESLEDPKSLKELSSAAVSENGNGN